MIEVYLSPDHEALNFQRYGPRRIGNTSMQPDKHLWGNVPALDILQLRDNEGDTFSEDVKLLFAGQ